MIPLPTSYNFSHHNVANVTVAVLVSVNNVTIILSCLANEDKKEPYSDMKTPTSVDSYIDLSQHHGQGLGKTLDILVLDDFDRVISLTNIRA